MEVVMDISHCTYETVFDFSIISATTYPEDVNEKDDFMKLYYKENLDDDLSWRRIKQDVLLIY